MSKVHRAKSKEVKPRPTISDVVYTAVNQCDGGSEGDVIKRASQLYGKALTPAQFKRALASFDNRGIGG